MLENLHYLLSCITVITLMFFDLMAIVIVAYTFYCKVVEDKEKKFRQTVVRDFVSSMSIIDDILERIENERN